MAGSEASCSDFVYDPVRLSPEGILFNRIDLEKHWDKNNGPANNPETGEPFDIKDIVPQPELRMQLRQRAAMRDEYFPGQKMLLLWTVIQDYPFDISDETHMSDYVNSVARWISAVITIPQDSTALWKSLNLLRLNCQYSEKNNRMFRSVNGFQKLIAALSEHFSFNGVRGSSHDMAFLSLDEDTLNICREIVKLVEITGFTAGDAVFITDIPSRAEGFAGILRILFFRGISMKDRGRIVRITHAVSNNEQFQFFDYFFGVIHFLLMDSFTPSQDLGLCADIAYAHCNDRFLGRAVSPLCFALKILVSRFYNSDETNANGKRVRVTEEHIDGSAAVEKVLKFLCRLCAKYGAEAVHYLTSPTQVGVVSSAILILKHALLHPEPGAATFGGRHLLYALLIIKYIYGGPAGDRALPEDVKIVFDFAMSAVPTRYLFNGQRKLKDLADQVVDNLLGRQPAAFVLRHWADFPL